MAFGKKTDFSTGRTLDLDKTYKHIIKPSVLAAGLECVRADEIIHAGNIDLPIFEQLLTAELMICDLSTLNPNVLYELGVRHALRPRSTIVIAEDGIRTFPFDINLVLVRSYHHLGEDIGFSEAERMRSELTHAIAAVLSDRHNDSPVYTFLNTLVPPALADPSPAPPTIAPQPPAPAAGPERVGESLAALMQQSDAAIASEDWDQARALLETARSTKGATDPYVLQRLALATYRSRKPTQRQAVEDARDILAALAPGTFNDPEVLSIWGAIHRRRGSFSTIAPPSTRPCQRIRRPSISAATTRMGSRWLSSSTPGRLPAKHSKGSPTSSPHSASVATSRPRVFAFSRNRATETATSMSTPYAPPSRKPGLDWGTMSGTRRNCGRRMKSRHTLRCARTRRTGLRDWPCSSSSRR